MKRFLITFFCCLSIHTFSFGQGVQIPVSEKIEKIDNVYFFVHTVEQGQTLYSIRKTYQVEEKDIKRTSEKPEIQIGEVLYIPVSPSLSHHITESNKPEEASAKAYPVDSTNLALADTSDLEMQKNINEDNEESEKRPRRGIRQKRRDKNRTDKDFAIMIDSVNQEDIDIKFHEKPYQETLNIAVLIPLYLDDAKTIKTYRGVKKSTIRPFTFIGFYQGILLGLENFESENVKFNVQFFDVIDEHSTKALIESGQLENANIIIGPLFLRSFRMMSEYALEKGIFIVNPLSDKRDILENNPYVLKLVSPEITQQKVLTNYILDSVHSQRLIVLSNDSIPFELDRSKEAKEHLTLEKDHQFDTIVYVDISMVKFDSLFRILKDSTANIKSNVFLYLSDNEAYITQILGQACKIEGLDNTLFCLKKLRQFDHTELEYLISLKTHYTDNFHIDYVSDTIKKFEEIFFEKYAGLPDNYAYIGYDLINYVLGLLSRYNAGFGDYIDEFDYPGLHNKIEMGHDSIRSGYENTGINIIRIEESNPKKVN